MIWSSVITNLTVQQTRRIDLLFAIAYEDDVDTAEKVLREIVEAHDAVLPEPSPMIHLHELAESSMNIIVRPWVNTEDYWTTYFDLVKAVKIRFDQAGISIPFPQRDLHIRGQSAG